MKILYVGPFTCDGTCLQRMETLKGLGFIVHGVSSLIPTENSKYRIVRFIMRKILKDIFSIFINYQIKSRIQKQSFDVLWIDKGLLISDQTLKFIKKIKPAIKIISYSPDDMMNPSNQSARYLSSIPSYDCHVTTKTYNVAELKDKGARDVFFVGNAYDPNVHHPVDVSADEPDIIAADVGFIGVYEKERCETMEYLAEAGVDLVFRCPSWPMKVPRPKRLRVIEGWLAADQYAKQICAFKINLGFLRKVNRDLQTTRTIEIPACGALMIAERTSEHEALFKDGEEALFFDSDHDLLNLILFYLNNDEKREKIAGLGLKRVKDSGYSNSARLKEVFKHIESLKSSS